MSRQTATLRVIGVEPAPQGSKRHVGNGRMIEASKKVAPFRQAVADAVEDLYQISGDRSKFTLPVNVDALFILPRPQSVKRLWPSKSPDLDKLCRSLNDGLSLERYGQLIEDDGLIVQMTAEKIYGTTEDMGVIVSIELADAPRHMMPLDFTEQ